VASQYPNGKPSINKISVLKKASRNVNNIAVKFMPLFLRHEEAVAF
jgi:hypothetical protein